MPDVVVRRDPGGEFAMANSGDRERLADAVTRIAIERGYDGIEPAHVARRCNLSTDDFFEHFENVDQCLLAAFDRLLERMLDHVAEACEEGLEWPDKVRLAVGAAFEFVAELEPVVRFFAVDAVRTGPAGIERKCASIERASLLLKKGRRLYPDATELPETTERVLVAGVVMAVSTRLLSEEGSRLWEIEAEVVELLLTPYVGLESARLVAVA